MEMNAAAAVGQTFNVRLPAFATNDSTSSRKNKILTWIQSISGLPTPPAIALQVIDKASDPDCDLRDLARIIETDPALCAKILRTVNSAVYGLNQPMTSLRSALSFLGIQPVRSLVLALSLTNVRWSPMPRDVLQTYWRVSVAGALAARQLAKAARRPAPDNDLVAGLMRDLGVLVLYQVFPTECQSVLSSSPEVLSQFQCELEESTLEMNHAEVSAELLRSWRLPEEITEPIRYHHNLDGAEHLRGDLLARTRLLYLASQIGQMQMTPNRPLLVREVLRLANEHFGMNESALGQFLESLQEQMNGFASYLEVDIGDGLDFAMVLSRGTEELARLAIGGTQTRLPTIRQATAVKAPSQVVRTLDHDDSGVWSLEDWKQRLFDGPSQPGRLGMIDGYEVTELLGRGAMGAVFKGIDLRLERPVAIKTILPQRASCETARDRFFREGRAIAALTHDNIVRVHAMGEVNDALYLVMEFVDGTNLEDRLEREFGPLPVNTIIRLGLETASGLAVAHARGIVHRDIKPSNLLLGHGSGRVKIADFGLVKFADQADVGEPGDLVGTPSFMAPEVVDGKDADSRSDMFSLGVVLYEACTGRLPFEGETISEVFWAICTKSPRPIRDLNPTLPAWIEEIVMGLLAKEPQRRFPSAPELKRLLLCQWARLVVGKCGSGR